MINTRETLDSLSLNIKDMKVLIQLLVTLCVTFFIGYLIGSFVYWDFNGGNWPLEGRQVIAAIIGFTACFTAMVIISNRTYNN
jgi:hypothetical protein